MTEEIFSQTQKRMLKTIDSLNQELTKLRTGRAHPSLLDHITVEYYGNPTPLSQVASINVEDARTLSINPWEKALVADIEKAIIQSDLGLNPATAGTVIRVPLPPLTEERRKDLIKIVRKEAENARIALRNIRRDTLTQFKDKVKNKELSEDDGRKAEERTQKLIDEYSDKIEKVVIQKEQEMMQV